ncbi:Tripartite tricarboxylate transporter family receptor [Pigmentiphaga humi]|uniref:Tripartite tricarboxylate transporter family receptor n=1 Tax=Pigmentiphaga humi TaxID=2478468 RepID=A0A3P4B264_9BURK|nr:tripartite tricarboxylate transporter substrate binding protein [Pigmentiphaga humi]VCU69235.1 Tripartite tricarboxylate transporter family receptor [Pigmentiphaga humi]
MKNPSKQRRPLRAAASFAACAPAIAAAALSLAAQPAWAQAKWPSKPIRLVVPFPPAGSADSVARLVAHTLSERLDQRVMVENKPGGNMVIGAADVARAAPDGHTLLFTLDTVFTVNPFAYGKLPYDPVKDFAPVSLVTTQSMWFVTNPKKPFRTMQELERVAKASPGTVNYGSGAIVGQLTGELMKSITHARMTFIPYKGSAPTAQALLAGDIDLAVADITPFAPHIKEGKLIALGQTGTSRSDFLPDVPTMIEQGWKDFEVTGWFAIYAPAATPPAIVSRLNGEIAAALATPDVKQRIWELGMNAMSSTPEELRQRAAKDAARWEPIIRAENIKLD